VRAIFGDLTGDAYEFNATLPAKEKLIEQNHAHIEDQEHVKARNQAEIAAQKNLNNSKPALPSSRQNIVMLYVSRN
jgi:hypothetical protein